MNLKVVLASLVLVALLMVGAFSSSLASPPPPTNGGNGAGQSGQCTGPASERPASCKSSH